MAKHITHSFFFLVLLFPLMRANEVTLEISSPTQKGSWPKYYNILLYFSIDGKHFMLGQCEYDKTAIIQELLPDGKVTTATDQKNMELIFFTFQFVYSIGGDHFVYGQNKDNKRWYIQRLFPGGKFGMIREGAAWSTFYDNPVPYSINGRQFFYAQAESSKRWFIHELVKYGLMGEEVNSGYWGGFYHCQLSFTINGRVFLYGQSYTLRFFVQELLPDGKMGEEIDGAYWFSYYVYQFPISVNGSYYLYTKDYGSTEVFMRVLSPDGTIGKTVGRDKSKLHHLFGYSIGGRTFLLAHASKDEGREWAIQEVLPVANGASVIKDIASERHLKHLAHLADSNLTSTDAPEIETSSTHTPEHNALSQSP